MTGARINARLDKATAKKLEAIKRRSGRSTSEILRAALDRLYEEEQQASSAPEAILRGSGFVGCASGPNDLSVTYKRSQRASLRRKSP